MSVRPDTTGTTRTDDICTAVTTAVADATETPIEQPPPLYDVVDPDALSTLFDGRLASGGVRVRFTIAGCQVEIEGGEVDVTPQAEPGTESVPVHTPSHT